MKIIRDLSLSALLFASMFAANPAFSEDIAEDNSSSVSSSENSEAVTSAPDDEVSESGSSSASSDEDLENNAANSGSEGEDKINELVKDLIVSKEMWCPQVSLISAKNDNKEIDQEYEVTCGDNEQETSEQVSDSSQKNSALYTVNLENKGASGTVEVHEYR